MSAIKDAAITVKEYTWDVAWDYKKTTALVALATTGLACYYKGFLNGAGLSKLSNVVVPYLNRGFELAKANKVTSAAVAVGVILVAAAVRYSFGGESVEAKRTRLKQEAKVAAVALEELDVPTETIKELEANVTAAESPKRKQEAEQELQAARAYEAAEAKLECAKEALQEFENANPVQVQ